MTSWKFGVFISCFVIKIVCCGFPVYSIVNENYSHYSLESRNNFHGSIEIANVPRGKSHPQDAGNHCSSGIVGGLRYDQLCYPSANLKQIKVEDLQVVKCHRKNKKDWGQEYRKK